MSLGYCQTFCREFNANDKEGTLVPLNSNPSAAQHTEDTPDRFKLIGILISIQENINPNATPASSIETLKFYDGDSGSADSLICTFPIILGLSSLSAN